MSLASPETDEVNAELAAAPGGVGVAPAEVVAEGGTRHDADRVLGIAETPGGDHATIAQ